MKPHLLALNLNGMVRDGDKVGKKILPLGQGDLDLALLKIIRDSGWRGPIGLLNHTDEDAEARLLDNLDGLDWLVGQLDGQPAGPKPKPRSWREPSRTGIQKSSATTSVAPAFGKALSGGRVVEGKPEYRALPLTIECWAKLESKQGFNILVASDPKASAEHWELYSYAGSGAFSVYQPGRGGEFKSDVNICDGQWHYLAAVLEPARVRLFVDGKLALDKPAKPMSGVPVPGALALGQLAEGTLGCDGLLDDVRMSRGVREIVGVPKEPFRLDDRTIGLWNFDEVESGAGESSVPNPLESETGGTPVLRSKYWAVEDPKEREKLQLYQVVPAAKPEELTPANGYPKFYDYEGYPANKPPWGTLNCIDLNTGKLVWKVPLGEYPELTAQGMKITGTENYGGAIVTAGGLVFCSGTRDHKIRAFDKETGAELWSA